MDYKEATVGTDDAPADGWPRVGWFVSRRISHLYPTGAAFERATKALDPAGVGLTFKTVKRYKSGEEIVRGDKRVLLLRALRWAGGDPDSIDIIRKGGVPVETHDGHGHGPPPDDDLTERMNQMQAQMNGIIDAVAELQRILRGESEGQSPDEPGGAEPPPSQ